MLIMYINFKTTRMYMAHLFFIVNRQLVGDFSSLFTVMALRILGYF